MLPPSTDPPAPALRDALALARLLYAAERAQAVPDAARLAALREAGELLRLALDQLGYEPGTLGRRAASLNAGRGLAALAGVELPSAVAGLVRVAAERVTPTPAHR